MPPQNPGDSWRYHYDTLWDSFDVMEEPEDEEDFFDELDILRNYESSEERFPAQYSSQSQKTSNDDEAGPSNTGEQDDTLENQTTTNDDTTSDVGPTFDHGDSESVGEQIQILDQADPISEEGRGKEKDKGHNIPCALDTESTAGTVVEKMATFLRESRIAKAMSDKTVVYESHVRAFWDTARFDETDKKIHAVLTKKDKNGKDIDVEIEFSVKDVRRVLDLQDSDDDPTIMSERLVKDLPKDSEDAMEMSIVNKVIIGRVTKDKDAKTKQMICRIKDKEYVAPENDKWRHDDSNSDNEDTKMNEMVEKKTRWWFVRDGKRKRTPKSSPAVVIPKDGENGSSREPQQKLVDEIVVEPSVVIEQGAELLKQTLESYLKKNEEIAAQQAQGTSVHAEKVTRVEPETKDQSDSSNGDSEATQSESELIPETLGRGKAQLKKRPSKKQKGSDEEDSPYDPEKSKKQRKKRKVAPVGVIPRNVRSKKSGADSQKDKEGKKVQHVQKEKPPSVDIPKEPEVKSKEIPVVETEKKTGDDDYVEITGFKAASPKPVQQNIPGSSHQKKEDFNFDFDNIGPATGIFSEDLPGESDMFNDKVVKELIQRVNKLEKEKGKAEEERDMLKSQIDDLMEAHNKIVAALVEKEKRMNQMKDDVEGNSKVFDSLTHGISSLNAKIKDLEDVNQKLNQLLNEMSEASSNEMKAMKLEMEAMKADKVMKDQQLQMLVAVVESHLKMNIHAAFDEIDVIKANERRMERERRVAEEANQKNKGVVEEVEVVDGSSSQLDAGGSSSQPDVEMIEVVEIQEPVEDDQEMVDAEEPHEPEFLVVGEPSEPVIVENILRRVEIIQRKRKAREVLLLEWKTDKFVLIGNAYPVPYNSKEVAKLLKFLDRKRKGRIARGEIVDEESDKELFRDDEEEDEEEEDEDKEDEDKSDDKDNDKSDKDDDNNDQGASGLLIREQNVQERVDELMNNELNEQEDEVEYEASSSGKQPVDQVLLYNPTVIYLSGKQQGEVEVRRTRAEMLEKLGLEDGKFKFDIEDEIPHSLAKDFEPRYPHEANHYDEVIVESASDSEEDRVDFHYEGEDVAFPTFTEMFQDKNEDELEKKD
ncbi:glutamic acid-rich protein-like [Helianthus annuus]|uniref:glutamic acid-rich protein-like n=1 Tax=Helianthus annuus TaxID=4232 RepID=UPI000B8EF246|nr:glutamic acid-rich protein-like [Helianthus annuus]